MRNAIRYFLLGLLIGIWLGSRRLSWPEGDARIAPARQPPRQQPAAKIPTTPEQRPTPEQPRPAPKRTPDPLTEIKGIGPAFEEALNQAGILTFAQLADQDPDTLATQLGGRANGARIRREQWIEQARERARAAR